MDSKKILETLVRIADNQQKAIMKLAQQQLDPNVAFLKTVGETAAMNLNTGKPISVSVQANAAQTVSDPSVTVEQGYTMHVTGLTDDKTKMQFKANVDRNLQAQKPQLMGSVSVIFA